MHLGLIEFMLIAVLKYAGKLELAASPSYTNTVKCKCFSVVSCGEKKKKKGRGGWQMWSRLPEASGSMVRHEP